MPTKGWNGQRYVVPRESGNKQKKKKHIMVKIERHAPVFQNVWNDRDGKIKEAWTI